MLFKDISSDSDLTVDFLAGKGTKKAAFAHTVFKRLAFVEFLEAMLNLCADRHGDELCTVVLIRFGTLSAFLENFALSTRPFPAQLSPAVGGNGGTGATAPGGSDDEEAGMATVGVGKAASATFVAFGTT